MLLGEPLKTREIKPGNILPEEMPRSVDTDSPVLAALESGA
jgi:hypothetical protein